MIIDVRSLRVEKPRDPRGDPKVIVEPASLRKSYWTLLPLAKEKVQGQGFVYVRTGCFQLPLIEGAVPTEILAKPIPLKEVYSRLASNDKGISLKLSQGASVIVRIQNPLLREAFNKNDDATYLSNVNTRFLDQFISAQSKTASLKADLFKFDTKKFVSYKSTSSQLPPVEDKVKFNKLLNRKFADATQISYTG